MESRISPSERTALVVRGIVASLTGDSSVVAELFSVDVEASLPKSTSSLHALAVEIDDRSDVFADVDLTILYDHSRDEQTWVEWQATVTHVGPLVIDDEVIRPTGSRVALHGVTVAELDGRLIVGFRQYWDYSELRHPGGERDTR